MTCGPRCTLVETTDLGGTVEYEFDPHIVVSGVETTAESATRGYQNDLAVLSGSKLLNGLVQQGNGGNMYIDHPCQGCDSASNPSVATPESRHEQGVCYHIETARNLAGPDDYVLGLEPQEYFHY